MMKNTIEKFKAFYDTTNAEVRWWSYAAWILPLVALAGIFFVMVIGWDDSQLHRLAIVGGVTFFSISTCWWWWALYKLMKVSSLMLHTAESLKDIGSELRDINREIHDQDK